MIKHIVAWRIKDTPSKAENAARIKELLEGLAGRIPGLLEIEVGINVIDDANAADVVLYSRFEDRAALAHYQTHPLHVAVAGEVRELTTERRSVDYLV
ncbi:MAG: Dabb family protein [Gammaproteobacteria bacterium]|jgi:quinol monooxygenase YgiN|nr:Dabb family protein [Gammaproteobacteria bacterium]